MAESKLWVSTPREKQSQPKRHIALTPSIKMPETLEGYPKSQAKLGASIPARTSMARRESI